MKQVGFGILLIAITALISCGKKVSGQDDQQMKYIIISEGQFAAEKMQIGTASPDVFETLVEARAFVVPSTNGKAIIQLPVSGKINRILIQPGQKLVKGSRLFEVGGSEVIDVQRNYAESAAAVKRLKSEFDRTRYLYEQKVNTEKEFLIIESEYLKAMANYAAAKLSIEALNLDVKRIEKGEFYPTYTVLSPIAGVVAKSQLVLGKFADCQTELMEIVDTKDLQLKISVFPVVVQKLKPGLLVRFSINGEKYSVYNGLLKSVGAMVDENLKTVDCYASINTHTPAGLSENQYVDAEIIISSDTLLSIPVGALLKSGSNNYVLKYVKKVEGSYYFSKQKVNFIKSNELRMGIQGIDTNTKILTAGAFNITVE